MSLPKVLMIGPGLAGGGAEGRFSRVASRVLGGKADVAVLVLPRAGRLQEQGHVLDLRWRGRASYLRIIAKLAHHIRRERYDVVVGFGLFPNVIAVMAARLSGTRARVVIHEITRPMRMLEGSGVVRRLLYRNLVRFVLARTDVMTANSIDGLAELRTICPTFDGPTMRLGNAIDIEFLNAQIALAGPHPMALPPRYIVCVARLVHMKKIDTVIAALALVSGGLELGLVIVGDGEARSALEEQANALGLRGRVIFTGKIANPLGVIHGADALIVASEYEGFSNSMLEAMVVGTPVITSFCNSDVREMEREGAVLGFAVGDVVHLGEHLIKVFEDAGVSEALRSAAFSYAQQHAIGPSIERYDDVLLSAAGIRR